MSQTPLSGFLSITSVPAAAGRKKLPIRAPFWALLWPTGVLGLALGTLGMPIGLLRQVWNQFGWLDGLEAKTKVSKLSRVAPFVHVVCKMQQLWYTFDSKLNLGANPEVETNTLRKHLGKGKLRNLVTQQPSNTLPT